MEGFLGIVRGNGEVEEARAIRAEDLPVHEWVRDSCQECRYQGRSWSCPPGAGSLEEARERLSGFSRAAFVRFRTSRDRKALERSVLDIEAGLREAGFGRAMGFFASPCTACEECGYPEECPKPEECRPTGESWGIDLMDASSRAGMPVEIARKGGDFKPVTVFLVD
jgi:predicted metal-binding protein